MTKIFPAILTATLLFIAGRSMAQCETYTVALASITQLGGPSAITWTITPINGNDIIASGTANFNTFTISSQAPVCLNPGCYSLNLIGNGIFMPNVSGGTILFNGAIVPSTNTPQYGTQVFTYQFCTETLPVTCSVEISVWEQLNNCEYIFQNNFETSIDGTIQWQWTIDGQPAGNEPGFETVFTSNGTHQVCAFMIVYQDNIPVCFADDCIEVVVEGCGNYNECPSEIWSSASYNCGTTVQFEVGTSQPEESVNWWFGDSNEQVNGGHFISHTYSEPGYYTVCAFYTSSICPGGVELCTEVLVEECSNECEGQIMANYNCPDGLVYLYVAGWPESADVNWYINGAVYSTPNNWLTWEIGDGGWMGVCASSNFCPQICQEVYIQNCDGDDCDLIVTQVGEIQNCEILILQALEIPQGAQVNWTQNGQPVNVGVITTFLLVPGNNHICAWYTFEGCSAEWCGNFAPCNTECTGVELSMDSYLNAGGPAWVSWSLSNEGEPVADGIAQYSNTDPWYDWSDCLSDGCYTLSICGIESYNPENFQISTGGWQILTINPSNCGVVVQLALNSDCGTQDCEAHFEPVYTSTPGHVEFINNSQYSGEASYVWSYGDGSVSDGQWGNAWYTQNGTYQVCLTITTSDGCTNTYCESVVIDDFNEECNGTWVQFEAQITYGNNTMSEDSWSISIQFNEEILVTLPFVSCTNCPATLSSPLLCLQDGCYTFTFNSTSPLNAQQINLIVSALSNGIYTELGEMSISVNQQEGQVDIGINDDCTNGLVESMSRDSGMVIYPNPAGDEINVLFSDFETAAHLKLFDVTGRIISTTIAQGLSTRLSLQNQPTGLYVIHYTGRNGHSVSCVEHIR